MVPDNVLRTGFWLLAGLIVLYLPMILGAYWLAKVRTGPSALGSVTRERELAGFFKERATQRWDGPANAAGMLFAMLVTGAGLVLSLPGAASYFGWASQGGSQSQLPDVSLAILFAFLGAFLFTVNTTARRFSVGDLNPEAFIQVATRTILAVIVAGIFNMAFRASGSEVLETTTAELALYTLLFVVGIFPEDGLNWILSFAARLVPGFARGDRSHDLQELAGLNRWQAIRLNVEGIDNVQNLANADTQELVRLTRFSVQQIFDWVDQSVLLMHLKSPEEFHKVQELGVRGWTDFQAAYRNDGTRKALAGVLETTSGVTGEQRLGVLYTAMRQVPSADAILLFWRYKSSYFSGAFAHFNRGEVFAGLDDQNKAIEEFSRAIDLNPLDPTLFIARGESQMALGRHEAARGNQHTAEHLFEQGIADFDKAVSLDQLSTEAHYRLGLAYLRRGQANAAIEEFDEALKLANAHVPALVERGRARQKLGQFTESLTDLDRAIQLDPAYVSAWVVRADTHRLKGDAQAALQDLDEAIRRDPRSADIYHSRGLLHAHTDPPRFEPAHRDFERAAELESASPAELYKDWGETYFRQGDFATAVEVLTDAIGFDMQCGAAYNLRGLARRALGEPAAAIEDYTYLITKIDPENADAYVNRGIARMDMGAAERRLALQDLSRAIELKPDLAVAYLHRAAVYRAAGDRNLAQANLVKALELDPKLSPAYNNLGELLRELNKDDEAIEKLDKAIELNSRYAEAYNNRALIRMARGQLASAQADLDQAITLDPDKSVYYFNRGLINLKASATDDAIRDMTNAIERNGQNVEAYVRRAEAYLAAQKPADADRDVQEALKLRPGDAAALALQQKLRQNGGS